MNKSSCFDKVKGAAAAAHSAVAYMQLQSLQQGFGSGLVAGIHKTKAGSGERYSPLAGSCS